MRLSKVIEHLYLKVLIGIVVFPEATEVSVALVKGSETVQKYFRRFEGKGVSAEMAAFIATYTAESPFHYIALLNTAVSQGALPVCTEKEAALFMDLSTSLTLCRKKGWMVHSSKPEIDVLQKHFKVFGLDFIFSPFVVLEQLFGDKIEGEAALYILAQASQISIAVFEKGRLLFAEHREIEQEAPAQTGAEEGGVHVSFDLDTDLLEQGIHLDDIDAIDDLEGLDDLGDIEDLDTIEEIEEFSEELSTEEPAFLDDTAEEAGQLDTFGADFKRFEAIQRALEHYYHDESYDNKFIESVYVADGCGVGPDLKRFLEEELFLKVVIRHANLVETVVELAKKEAKYAV